VDPGTVMVLGNEGALSESQQAYDKRVAGVISGAGGYKPGIVLDKQQTSGNRQPIALMGKVFCKVDAQFGAIEVGDLLTTSPTPGTRDEDKRSIQGIRRGDRQGFAPADRRSGADSNFNRIAVRRK